MPYCLARRLCGISSVLIIVNTPLQGCSLDRARGVVRWAINIRPPELSRNTSDRIRTYCRRPASGPLHTAILCMPVRMKKLIYERIFLRLLRFLFRHEYEYSYFSFYQVLVLTSSMPKRIRVVVQRGGQNILVVFGPGPALIRQRGGAGRTAVAHVTSAMYSVLRTLRRESPATAHRARSQEPGVRLFSLDWN
eukprot:scaffold12117_cov33-Prasinocladus_malaysianus.AAC.1